MKRRDFLAAVTIGAGAGDGVGRYLAQRSDCQVGEYSIGGEAVEMYGEEILGSDIIVEHVSVEGYGPEEEHWQEIKNNTA